MQEYPRDGSLLERGAWLYERLTTEAPDKVLKDGLEAGLDALMDQWELFDQDTTEEPWPMDSDEARRALWEYLTRELLGPPETHRIPRDGGRDLEVHGWLIGEGSHGYGGTYPSDWTRGTVVRIYRTVSGRYVTAVRQWSAWEGESDSHRAAVCDEPEGVLRWLVDDASGKLGPASKEAWRNACLTDPDLHGLDVERVD